MTATRIVFACLIIIAMVISALSISCKLCWPPTDEDSCKESEEEIDCDPWEGLQYDSCIEVEYPGNRSLARTCYPSWKCNHASEWCRKNGPCTVRHCCQSNNCNGGDASAKLYAVHVVVATVVPMAACYVAHH